MQYTRQSVTLYNVTQLYHALQYPPIMLEFGSKGWFFNTTLCWFMRHRFRVNATSKGYSKRRTYLVESATEFVLRDIEVRAKLDPTLTIRFLLAAHFDRLEQYINNPTERYADKETGLVVNPIALSSNHRCKFKLMRPRQPYIKRDPFAIRVLGQAHYYLGIYEEGEI